MLTNIKEVGEVTLLMLHHNWVVQCQSFPVDKYEYEKRNRGMELNLDANMSDSKLKNDSIFFKESTIFIKERIPTNKIE